MTGFIGNADFALSDVASVEYGNALFLWYWVFCAASTTILVGSMAERCTFISYIIFTAFYACWVSLLGSSSRSQGECHKPKGLIPACLPSPSDLSCSSTLDLVGKRLAHRQQQQFYPRDRFNWFCRFGGGPYHWGICCADGIYCVGGTGRALWQSRHAAPLYGGSQSRAVPFGDVFTLAWMVGSSWII